MSQSQTEQTEQTEQNGQTEQNDDENDESVNNVNNFKSDNSFSSRLSRRIESSFGVEGEPLFKSLFEQWKFTLEGLKKSALGIISLSPTNFFAGLMELVFGFIYGTLGSLNLFLFWVKLFIFRVMVLVATFKWKPTVEIRGMVVWKLLDNVLRTISPFGVISSIGFIREFIGSIQSGRAFGKFFNIYMQKLIIFIKTGISNPVSLIRFFSPFSDLIGAKTYECYLPINTEVDYDTYSRVWKKLKASKEWRSILSNGNLELLEDYRKQWYGNKKTFLQKLNFSNTPENKTPAEIDKERLSEAFNSIVIYINNLIDMFEFSTGNPTDSQIKIRILNLVMNDLDRVEKYTPTNVNFRKRMKPSDEILSICKSYHKKSQEFSLVYKGITLPVVPIRMIQQWWELRSLNNAYTEMLNEAKVNFAEIEDLESSIKICKSWTPDLCGSARQMFYDNSTERKNSITNTYDYRPLVFYKNLCKRTVNALSVFYRMNNNLSGLNLKQIEQTRKEFKQVSEIFLNNLKVMRENMNEFINTNPDVTKKATELTIIANKVKERVYAYINAIKVKHQNFIKDLDTIDNNLNKYGLEGIALNLKSQITPYKNLANENLKTMSSVVKKIQTRYEPTFTNVQDITPKLYKLEEDYKKLAEKEIMVNFTETFEDIYVSLKSDYDIIYKNNIQFRKIRAKIKSKSSELVSGIQTNFSKFYKYYGPLSYIDRSIPTDTEKKKELNENVMVFIMNNEKYGGKPPKIKKKSLISDLTTPDSIPPYIQEAIDEIMSYENKSNAISMSKTVENPTLIDKHCKDIYKKTKETFPDIINENFTSSHTQFKTQRAKLSKHLGEDHKLISNLNSCVRGNKVIGINTTAEEFLKIDTSEETSVDINELYDKLLQNESRYRENYINPLVEGTKKGKELYNQYNKYTSYFIENYKKDVDIIRSLILSNTKRIKNIRQSLELKIARTAIFEGSKTYKKLTKEFTDWVIDADSYIKMINEIKFKPHNLLKPIEMENFETQFKNSKTWNDGEIMLKKIIQKAGNIINQIESVNFDGYDDNSNPTIWVNKMWDTIVGKNAAKEVEKTLELEGVIIDGKFIENLSAGEEISYFNQIESAKTNAIVNTVVWIAGFVGLTVAVGYVYKKIKNRKLKKKAKPIKMNLVLKAYRGNKKLSLKKNKYMNVYNVLKQKFKLNDEDSPVVYKNGELHIPVALSKITYIPLYDRFIEYMTEKEYTDQQSEIIFKNLTRKKFQSKSEDWKTLVLPVNL